MRRILLALFCGIVLLGIAGLSFGPADEEATTRAAHSLQIELQDSAERLRTIVAATADELATVPLDTFIVRHGPRSIEHWKQEGLEVLVFQADELVFWSGRAPITGSTFSNEVDGHVALADGVYLHSERAIGPMRVHGLRMIWYAPPIENRHLVKGFHPTLNVPAKLVALMGPGTGPVVRDAEGHVLFRIGVEEDRKNSTTPTILFLLALLGSMCILYALWLSALRVGDRFLLLADLIMLLPIILWLALPSIGTLPFWVGTPLFDPGLYASSRFFPSLGDLLFDLILLLTFSLWVRQRVRERSVQGPLSQVMSWALLLAAFVVANWVNGMLVGLVADSRIPLDLYRVQDFDRFSALSLFAVAMLFGVWLLIADAWALAVRKDDLARTLVQLVLLGAGFALWRHLQGEFDTAFMLWPLPLLALLLVAERDRFGFPHIVAALAVLAAFGAHAIIGAVEDRVTRERAVVAERLLAEEDPVVEQLFREVSPALRSDDELYRLLTSPNGCVAADLDRLIRQEHFTGYWDRYDVRLYAFGPEGRLLCSTDAGPPEAFPDPLNAIGQGLAPADMPDLFIGSDKEQRKFYHARVAVMMNDSAPPAQLVVELHPRLLSEGLGYPELLLSGDDMNAGLVHRDDRARYENGILVEQIGDTPFPIQWNHGRQIVMKSSKELHPYGDPAGTLLVLGVFTPTLLDRATGFSYLFAVLSALAALVLLGAALLRKGPGIRPTIASKVRLALVSFSLVVLVVFGVGAQRLMSRSYAAQSTAALLEKARSVNAELQRKLTGAGPLDGDSDPYLDHVLSRLSNIFFTDIHVFRKDGKVISTSRPQAFASGLVGQWMDPSAFFELHYVQSSSYVHNELLGTTEHRAAYLPLRDDRGVLLGYLGLPSFGEQAREERDRSAVLVAVANLFVLLFALSMLVAVFISNWTMRPLDLLKRSLARVALTGANEPLRYAGRDEVGQLVEVYNKKVEELRESAEKLARGEREIAWREMARQVAHEIKNPLTPMKLSIQHFQRTWRPDLPEAQEKLVRFGDGLVQQIDVLSRIAGEFSNFAQMPPAQLERIDLREVIRAAIDLYHGDRRATITLDASGPVMVNADREHLLRVFNNLLSNALQAIPEGQAGKVEVRLQANEGNAQVEVQDNGRGISREYQAHVFEPSFTTRSTGMGLGLAMVKRIVENAGGSVRFSTVEGKGTSFFVSLPLHS